MPLKLTFTADEIGIARLHYVLLNHNPDPKNEALVIISATMPQSVISHPVVRYMYLAMQADPKRFMRLAEDILSKPRMGDIEAEDEGERIEINVNAIFAITDLNRWLNELLNTSLHPASTEQTDD